MFIGCCTDAAPSEIGRKVSAEVLMMSDVLKWMAISVAEIIGSGENMIEQHLLLLSINFHLSLHLLKDDRSTCSKVQSVS